MTKKTLNTPNPTALTDPALAAVGVAAGDSLNYSASLTGGAALPAWLWFDGATRTFGMAAHKAPDSGDSIRATDWKDEKTPDSTTWGGEVADSVVATTAAVNRPPSFAWGDGKLTADFGGSVQSVTFQADGKILAAGSSGGDFALARYNPDGGLDRSFSGDGRLTTDFGSRDDYGRSVTVQADGKILVAGSSGCDFALARYNADGGLDESFSGNGRLTTDFGTWDRGYSVTVQADGKILVAGSSGGDFALARYHPDGSLDSSFSGDGKLTTDFGADDGGASVTVQADGKILVAGSSGYYRSNNFALARYNPDGSLDTGFSGDGRLTTNFGADDIGLSVTLQADGKILVAGSSGGDFALARYNPDGSLDTRFGIPTVNESPLYTELSAAVRLDSNVAVSDPELAAGGNYAGARLTLSRHGGANATDVFSAAGNLAAFTHGGQLLLAGVDIGTVTQNSGGVLTLTFNANATQARVNETLISLAYANTGKIAAATVQIDWVFSDGNTGAQGAGGVLSDRASTTVRINHIPTVVTPLADQSATAYTAFRLVVPANSFADVDSGDVLTYAASLGDGGDLPTWLRFDAATRTFTGKASNLDLLPLTIRLTVHDNQNASVSSTFTLSVHENRNVLGDANDNVLHGTLGNDVINGGAGADTLHGRTGDDIYLVDNTGDIVVERVGEGMDSVRSSVTHTLPANVENLGLIGTTAINGTGNGLNNRLIGNSAANVLNGGAGDDTLIGGLGADRLTGGVGDDLYLVDNTGDVVVEHADAGMDTVRSSVTYTLPANVENLALTGTAAINGTGNTLNNTLIGNSAANVLNGGAGDDTLNGGLGADRLTGGVGADTLTGGFGADTFSYLRAADSGVTVASRDIIQGFSRAQGDKIDLSALDANSVVAGDQAFVSFAQGAAFSGRFAAQASLFLDQTARILYGNNDADLEADFSIQLTGVNSLALTDFIA